MVERNLDGGSKSCIIYQRGLAKDAFNCILLLLASLAVLFSLAQVGVVYGRFNDGNDLMTRRDDYWVCLLASICVQGCMVSIF